MIVVVYTLNGKYETLLFIASLLIDGLIRDSTRLMIVYLMHGGKISLTLTSYLTLLISLYRMLKVTLVPRLYTIKDVGKGLTLNRCLYGMSRDDIEALE